MKKMKPCKKVKKCPSCGEPNVKIVMSHHGEWVCEVCVYYGLDKEDENGR